MNAVHFRSKAGLPNVITRSLLIGTLSIAGVLFGLAPQFQPRSLMPTLSTAAYAQNLSNTEVQRYASSVLRIEPLRQEAYRQIKAILGSGEVPSIACHQPNSINGLPRNIREIAQRYCTQSIQIVEQNGLTIGRFNEITGDLQRDGSLASRIQQEMIRQQRAGQ